MKEHIWLVILYDRHADELYQWTVTLAKAVVLANSLMQSYGRRYEWIRDDPYETLDEHFIEPGDWLYRHTTFDDGPRLHIQRVNRRL